MEEFTKKINLFKLKFDGEKRIYKYDEIPEAENEYDFVIRGNGYYLLKKVGSPDETDFNLYTIRKLIENNRQNESIFSMFKGFEYRFVPIMDDMFLSVDYKLITKVTASIQDFINLNTPKQSLIGNSVEFNDIGKEKCNSTLISISDKGDCIVDFFEKSIESVSADELYHLCRPEVIQHILKESSAG